MGVRVVVSGLRALALGGRVRDVERVGGGNDGSKEAGGSVCGRRLQAALLLALQGCDYLVGRDALLSYQLSVGFCD